MPSLARLRAEADGWIVVGTTATEPVAGLWPCPLLSMAACGSPPRACSAAVSPLDAFSPRGASWSALGALSVLSACCALVAAGVAAALISYADDPDGAAVGPQRGPCAATRADHCSVICWTARICFGSTMKLLKSLNSMCQTLFRAPVSAALPLQLDPSPLFTTAPDPLNPVPGAPVNMDDMAPSNPPPSSPF